MLEITDKKFGKEFTKELKELIKEHTRLVLLAENHSKLTTELRETNNAMLSTKQNEVMKTFTILAFITLPLTVIAAIFGMNSQHIPIIGMEGDFWIIIGIMFFATSCMFLYFKIRKWI